MNKKILAGIFALILLVLVGTSAESRKGGPSSSGDAAVLAAFDGLEEYIGSLANEVLKKGQRTSLSRKLKNAEKVYQRGQPCTAGNILQAYLNETQALHKGKHLEIAEDLYNRGWTLLYDLLVSLPEGQTCPRFQRFGMEPETDLIESDNIHLVSTVTFGQPMMLSVQGEGEMFTQLLFPGLETGEAAGGPSAVGFPEVQMYYFLIAVPIGAQPILNLLNHTSWTIQGVNLYPHQGSAVDVLDQEPPPPETFMDPPFTKDEEAYEQDALFPEQVVSMQVVGQMRDVNLVQVSIAAAQYNPVSQTLVINEQVEVEVFYEGGTGYFIPNRATNPFESYNIRPIVEQSLLNGRTVYEYVGPGVIQWIDWGEELLIITHEDFIDAANDLKDWKKEKGITTKVFKAGPSQNSIPATTADIRDFIQDRYDNNLIRPSYVLLLGDADFIPCFYRNSSGSPTTGTDLDYSLMAGADLVADLGVARIPVDTAQQAQDVVDKIINYEKNPPWAPDFYRTASFPAYFQCCRTDVTQIGRTSRAYIETMELIRDVLVAPLPGYNYNVDRLYFSDTTYHPTYTSNDTPRRYRDGTALPAALGPTSGFLWDADTQDIIDAIDLGRFLVIHRNHGGHSLWVSPEFQTGDVDDLDNDNLLPVLFSVDCATGFFDNETTTSAYDTNHYGTTVGGVYLLEALLRKADGGVVGALGDTRNSPTWANNALTRGFADAVFPDVLPAYGGAASIRRLADILNYGKTYMFSQVGVAQTAGSVIQNNADSNNVMWHAYGDPTQEIWTAQPITLGRVYVHEFLENRLIVEYYMEGAVITATQGEMPIGRATVINGQAELEFVVEPNPELPIALSASKPNYISRRLYNCYPDLPSPNLIYTESENYTVDGVEFTRYKLEVTNSEDFPDELFIPSPHLEPCGLNTNSSRTWVDIYDNNNNRLYGFCALSSSDGLKSLWFAKPQGTPPPDSVYITMVDRECEITYTSNLTTIPLPDLVVTEVTLDTTTVTEGGTLGFSYTIDNIDGEGPAGNSTFDVAAYLSTDAVLDGSDTMVLGPGGSSGSYSVWTYHLDVGWSHSLSVGDGVIEASSGTYYLIVDADTLPGQPPNNYPGVVESDETNNWTASAAFTVTAVP